MDPRLAGGYLTIDLVALQNNYRLLSEKLQRAKCAAVVKANAYGLGLERIAPALAAAGCRAFFVALPDEGIQLRRLLPEVDIYILGGLFQDCEDVYVHDRLAPVLNSLEEIRSWSAQTRQAGPLPAILHLETGICRLGLTQADITTLGQNPEWLDGLEIDYLMSHLASADDPQASQNLQQLDLFHTLRKQLPAGLQKTPVSFANSSGVFLGSDFQGDLARPGIALYGGNPTPHTRNPMQAVVEWQGKILQVHDVDSQMPVGYGASYQTKEKARIATVAIGYADGYFRCLGNKAECVIDNKRVPVVGRVSMDMITIDVTAIPREKSKRGDLVNLIGAGLTLDELAAMAGTIPYEILTSLGHRCHRRYLEDGA